MEINLENPNLDDFLPNELIEKDLSNLLWEDDPDVPIELEEESIVVPVGIPLEIVSKSYRQNVYEGGFGNHYATLVAIGGVSDRDGGYLEAQYCFATLFYSSEKSLITVDFHSEMR